MKAEVSGRTPAHLTIAERVAIGKAARRVTPRSKHAGFEPSPSRDPVGLLQSQSVARVPELVPLRYGRMLLSPFSFYRGAALIMASDLATTPRSGLTVQCCGDAHLANFGVFASPERRLVFDINDFDETAAGPWEWDVKRLATSMLIAARHRGFAAKAQHQVVLDMASSYRTAMRQFAEMGNLEVWYATLDVEATLARLAPEVHAKQVKRTERVIAKARTRDHLSAFSKLTSEQDGRVRIIADPPLVIPIADLAGGVERASLFASFRDLLQGYEATLQPDRRNLLRQFELVDIARKVVGVGSVGTRAWIALLLGRDGHDPLFLQLKEAQQSVLARFTENGAFKNEGERVVYGQRLMQASSDIFLGWLHVVSGLDEQERDFYVRQLRDWKGSAEIDEMEPEGMSAYGRLCGWTLARAHARSGDRVALAAYLGAGTSFERAIVEFAQAYAEQNERDYAALRSAAQTGDLAVARED